MKTHLTRREIGFGLQGCNDTIDLITREDLEPQNTIRLYFTIPSLTTVNGSLGNIQSVIECYNINSIFEYVFSQIHDNKIRTESNLPLRPIMTPLRKSITVTNQ